MVNLAEWISASLYAEPLRRYHPERSLTEQTGMPGGTSSDAGYKQLKLSPLRVLGTLLAITAVLVSLSLAGQLMKYWAGHGSLYGLVHFFNLDEELNLPSFFSGLILGTAAALIAVIACIKRADNDRFAVHWMALSVGFFYMTADEIFSFHEKLGPPLRAFFGGRPLGVWHFAWVIPGIVVVICVGLCYTRFLMHLPARFRTLFLASATIYLGGVIGIEMLAGRYMELYGQMNLTYSLYATLEETLEMVGVILFIYALLKYLAETYREVRFSFQAEDRTEASGKAHRKMHEEYTLQ